MRDGPAGGLAAPPPIRRASLLGGHRSTAALLLVGLVTAGFAYVALGSRPQLSGLAPATSPPLTSPSSPLAGGGYLTSLADLRQRARLAEEGVEPYHAAVADLLAFAGRAMQAQPSPQDPLTIPGTGGPFVDDTAAAYGLALAYGVTGDIAFARHSRDFITAWVVHTQSTLGACPDSGACQTSLIISRTVPGFVFAADLIERSGVMGAADVAAFRLWLRTLILPVASRLDNNWGDAGTFTRVVVADYLGDALAFDEAIAKWKAQLDLVAPDGHIPLEVARGRTGLSYSQEALDYKVAVAEIAAHRGLDLWTYRGNGGATLRTAVDYLAGYWFDPGAWPWYADPTVPSPSGLWEIAYARWRDPAYEPIIELRRPFGSQGHSAVRWTTLTSGIPFSAPPPTRSP